MRVFRKLCPISRRNDVFNILLSRRLALPCTFISDTDSSTSDDSSYDSVSVSQPSVTIARRCACSFGTTTGARDVCLPNRRKYSFSRCWYSKEEMLSRVSLVLSERGWDCGYLNGPKIQLDASHVSLIMNALFDGTSDAALAFFFFRWSQRRNGSNHETHAVCTMIHISVLGNMNHIAMKFLRDLVRCRRGGSHDSLFHVLKETSKDRKATETVYSMLLSCYLDQDMLDVALKLLDAMKVLGMYPAAGVCIALIKRLLKSKNLELTFSVFAEALYHGRDLINQTLSLLIHHCCVRGNLADAFKLFSEMYKYGCQPDVVSYTIIIDSLCKSGYLKEATSLLHKLGQEGISPDSLLTSSIVDGYCKAGRLTEAVSVLKVLDCAPDEFIYNSFVHRLCDEGNMLEATELVNEMSESGAFPDCCNWTTVIYGYSRANQVGQALKIFGGMLKRGIKPALLTYTVLIDCYCKLGDVREAESLINVMEKSGLRPDLVAYNVLIYGHSMKGEMQKAFKVLNVMKAGGIYPNLVTYNILIHGFVKKGSLMEAREVLTELSGRGYSPDRFTYTILMNGFFEAGNFQETFHIWSHMSKSGNRPDVISCSVLLSGFCKAQRMQEAHAFFRKMLEDGLSLTWHCDLLEAFRLLNMMAENNIIPNYITYSALVHGLKKNNVHDSKEVAAIRIQQALAKNNIFVDNSTYVAPCA
ncbi:unnamed protein product [Spirodela intermedia]|uniref:Uncharacterized protein n=1 Tax=Spirodela intermedia TaxID=51605 RepID=A0A7I8IC42_SPIIN|nr:unnamed protein product [Spirodela intermedia]CAA6654451.1 unnamed protein product [Spirodela intermedia]